MAFFGTSKDKEQPMAKQVSAATPNQVNIIAKGTVFEGTLKADSDVSVSGRIIGKLEVSGRAVVAPDGTVEGEIKASNANISGTVLGDLIIAERLLLGSSARVEGTIKTGRLIIEEGATFNGECQMGQPGQIRKKTSIGLKGTVPAKRPDVPHDDQLERKDINKAIAVPSEQLSSKF